MPAALVGLVAVLTAVRYGAVSAHVQPEPRLRGAEPDAALSAAALHPARGRAAATARQDTGKSIPRAPETDCSLPATALHIFNVYFKESVLCSFCLLYTNSLFPECVTTHALLMFF